jgi:hypothetical protein
MTIETLIYTTSPTRWMSRHESRVRKNLEKAKGVKAAPFEYEHIKLGSVPLRAYPDGDIKPDWKWFTATLTTRAQARGFNNIILHLSRKDAKRFGIKGIVGSYNRDRVPDDVWESVIICDKGQDAKGYDNLPEFVRLVVHEAAHPAAIITFGPDTKIVHEMDSGEGVAKGKRQIESLWPLFDLTPPMYPIDKKYIAKPSQRFLNPSKHYKSGLHNGVDFPCPVGTPVRALADGVLIKSGPNHPSLGIHVYYTCIIASRRVWLRHLHLSKAMPLGAYRKGDIIGLSGNTGDSSGPHLHWDAWNRPIDTSLIGTAAGVRKHMIDPLTLVPAV